MALPKEAGSISGTASAVALTVIMYGVPDESPAQEAPVVVEKFVFIDEPTPVGVSLV
jgi:hypothetical protein